MSENDKRNEAYTAAMAMLLAYMQLNKKAVDYGVGVQLHRVEIHTIEYIGKNPNMNVKDIATHFHITNAAASQTISKLGKKGMIKKLYSKDDQRDVLISLTSLGYKAYEGHIEYHKQNRSSYMDVFDEMTDNEQSAVIRFLRSYTESMEKVLNQ